MEVLRRSAAQLQRHITKPRIVRVQNCARKHAVFRAMQGQLVQLLLDAIE